MSNRARVPARLHSELSEYAQLLKTLRTKHTLDLSSHLSQHAVASTSNPADDTDDEGDDTDAQRATSPPVTSDADGDGFPPTAAPSPPTPASNSKSKGKRRRKCGNNDTWTRWPLLAGDVHEPEWGLEEEVRLIAERARMAHNANLELPESETEHTYDSPALVHLTSAHLSRLLAALEHHVPLVERSLYDRLRPMSWTQVLACVGACGLVSPR